MTVILIWCVSLVYLLGLCHDAVPLVWLDGVKLTLSTRAHVGRDSGCCVILQHTDM